MKKTVQRNAISGSFTLGRDGYDKIGAVEGRVLTRDMKGEFRKFDKENLPSDQRRKRIAEKYGKKHA